MNKDKTKDLARKQFGREASKYVTSLIHSSKNDLQFVREFINPKEHWQVLDIATGAGHLGLTLAPHVASVVASDITPEMLQEASQLASNRDITNLSTEVIDAHNIPYDDQSFDLVASRIAPHHFHDVEEAIAEMVRVTKTGGYVFIQDTVAPEDPDAADIFNQLEKLRDPSHVRDLSPNQWKALLEQNGCRITRHYTKTKDWPLKWWTERMSTVKDNVIEIIQILENIYDEYKDIIHIKREKEYLELNPKKSEANLDRVITQWSLHPRNGYFLAEKV